MTSDPLWIFGYGSLVWRTEFPYRCRRPAHITGWKRRFWQGSTDHRGIPGAPGRVATLLPARDNICWGIAYQPDPGTTDRILDNLDYREKGGYERHTIKLHFDDGNFTNGIMYVATEHNANYLGPACSREIAQQIAQAEGPSGSNKEYLLMLAKTLEEIDAEDAHVTELVQQLKALNQ
jgi:cation transport regulator ChaC